jgi:hypothetical protein
MQAGHVLDVVLGHVGAVDQRDLVRARHTEDTIDIRLPQIPEYHVPVQRQSRADVPDGLHGHRPVGCHGLLDGQRFFELRHNGYLSHRGAPFVEGIREKRPRKCRPPHVTAYHPVVERASRWVSGMR